ncbi:hypothetical protein AURDEDRAFT_177145 [Auricularia subglabra TFB-10046 SS5]|uniref:Uncharacterized protein n=1 Tax=Auricularia subglabra (strain TFB-10046 / SS5) TaxID=717982 RepID=J0WN30_AURST|nr:hypothetical protein AURDEDRAFT_177145 [Auricularia subglabra TFB-10046 SS5]
MSFLSESAMPLCRSSSLRDRTFLVDASRQNTAAHERVSWAIVGMPVALPLFDDLPPSATLLLVVGLRALSEGARTCRPRLAQFTLQVLSGLGFSQAVPAMIV